jgi:hypothetical protein
LSQGAPLVAFRTSVRKPAGIESAVLGDRAAEGPDFVRPVDTSIKTTSSAQ